MTLKVLGTDYSWTVVQRQENILADAGISLVTAQDSSEDALIEQVSNADGLITGLAQITDRVLRAAPKCKVVSRGGVGVDNIDIATATELGIAVAYVPDYCVGEVADHVMAMLLGWNRRLVQFDRSVRDVGWEVRDSEFSIARLSGMTLGIIGLGRIGRAVALRAAPFGMEVLASDPVVTAGQASSLGATLVDTHSLLLRSDYVTVHAPLTARTRNMIGGPELASMKPTAFLINASRGPLIDESALYEALTSGSIAGAGLDVLTDESSAGSNPLLSLPNVIVTPHVAYLSQEALTELEERVAHAVVDVLQCRVPRNLANPEILGRSRAGF